MIYLSKSGMVTEPICAGNRSSIEIYKKCVENYNNIFNSNPSYTDWAKIPESSNSDKSYLLDEFYVGHFVKPKDRLIKFNKTNTFGTSLTRINVKLK